MKWLDDLVASVPPDFVGEAQELPKNATELGPLPDDLVPIARTWLYVRHQFAQKSRASLKDAFGVLTDLLTGQKPAYNPGQAKPALEVIERLARRDEALSALLSAALWEQFPEAEESVGTTFTRDGWLVFTAPDEREREPRVGIGILEAP